MGLMPGAAHGETLARKVCPICGTVSHPNAAVCPTCGTSLAEVRPENGHRRASKLPGYDRRYGETDLFEGEGKRSGEWLLTGIGALVLAGLCIAALAFALPGVRNALAPEPTIEPTGLASSTVPGAILVTNTARPTMVPLATVTPAPPTITPPPTEGPCTYVIQAGDDLISLAYACGHRSLDIVPAILDLNGLSAPEAIQIGQTILIPRPTPTPDPNAAAAAPTSTGGAGASDVAALFVSEPNATPPTATLIPTATLLAGLMWHIVQPQESMVAIMYQYNTTAEVLAQINPEIAFSQCDFQYDSGGDSCTVLLQPGQQFRVPAPTPTPTLSPTPSGSETATPTATATYNAPNLLSPAERTRFTADQIVTLRWVTTGQLGPDEKYWVTVVDDTAGRSWTGETTDLTFIIPADWQGTDGQPHVFRWSVGVAGGGSNALRYETPARSFIWNSQGTAP